MTGDEMRDVDGSTDRSFDVPARRLKELLTLESHPIAVFLLAVSDERATAFVAYERGRAHRYCQVLMRARQGAAVVVGPSELACPAAAAAFGFRPLPDGLASGRGLVEFGIVRAADTGRTMFEHMPRLVRGSVAAVAACPLSMAPSVPDVVIVEDQPEALMWLVLADLNLHGGARRRGDTAVLQAACVDATVIPHLERRLNFSLGCYGCREATDLPPQAAILGFPGVRLHPLLDELEALASKALPRSRAKGALAGLTSRMA